MLTVLTLMSKVAFSPLWLLWQLYNGLWWAFQDDPRSAPKAFSAPGDAALQAAAEPGQARAFEVVDTAPQPRPRPVAVLRGGFFGSLGIALSLAYLANVMVMNHWLDPARAAAAWMLTSAATLVASLYAVRAAVRRDEAARVARAARGGPVRRLWRATPGHEQVGKVAGRAADAVGSAAGAAGAAARATKVGAAAVKLNAPKAAAACTAGLRCGIGRLATSLSKLEARLGVPKTAPAGDRR